MVRHDHAIERAAGVGFLQEIARVIQPLGQTGRAGEDVGQPPAPVIAVGHIRRRVAVIHHPQFAGVVIRVVSRDAPRPSAGFQAARRGVGVAGAGVIGVLLLVQPAAPSKFWKARAISLAFSFLGLHHAGHYTA